MHLTTLIDSIIHSVLSLVFMNIHRLAFICEGISKATLAIGAGVVIGSLAVNAASKHLDALTVEQCASQSWPAHQHAEHVAFCAEYLSNR